MKELMSPQAFVQAATPTLEAVWSRLHNLPHLDGKTLTPKSTLWVCVDMNNGFCKAGALSSPLVEELIAPLAAMLKNAEAAGHQMLAFTDSHTPLSPEFLSFPPHCVQGTGEERLVEELAFLQPYLREKNSTNAFLTGDLPLQGIDTVVVTGCCTDICIHQFAITLKAACNQQNRQLRVVVPMDLNETYDAPSHGAEVMNYLFLDSLLSAGVEVVKSITNL